jgi:DNA-binding IclR family transcriptional regulator
LLEAVGLGPAEEDAYRVLLDAVETDVRDLARVLHVSPDEAHRLLEGLRDRALVSRLDGDEGRYAAVPPDVGLTPGILRQQEALERARSEVDRLADTHRASLRRRHATDLVEVITGRVAIRQALRSFQETTREESLWFCRAGHVAMSSGDNVEELAMLARGVAYRVIYERALLEEPGMIDNVALGIEHGEVARAVPSLPVRLAIADRRVALCPLVVSGDVPGEPTVALVRDSSLLAALIALFDVFWASASPLHPGTAGSAADGAIEPGVEDAVTADDRHLLSLLVAGVTDRAIAAQLHISQRTVQRRVRDLMDRSQAETRMQLGWQAAQRGWL